MPKVTEEYKQQKRQHILDCAMECFAEDGYEKATMDDIVVRSGMSKGALYNYFKSKDDIYLNLLEHSNERTFNYFLDGFDELSTSTEKVIHLFNIYSKTNLDDMSIGKQRVHLEFYINSSKNEHLRQAMIEHSKKYISFLVKIIEEGKRTGEFKSDLNSQVTAEAFWAINDGIRLHLIVLRDDYMFSDMYRHTKQMYLDFLQNIKRQ